MNPDFRIRASKLVLKAVVQDASDLRVIEVELVERQSGPFG